MDNIHEKKIAILLRSVKDSIEPALNANLMHDVEELEELINGMHADIKSAKKLVEKVLAENS